MADLYQFSSLLVNAHELRHCSLYMLYKELGWAFLAELGASLVLIPVKNYIATKIGDLSAKMMQMRDARIKLGSPKKPWPGQKNISSERVGPVDAHSEAEQLGGILRGQNRRNSTEGIGAPALHQILGRHLRLPLGNSSAIFHLLYLFLLPSRPLRPL